ncbi:unnamed protein product [Phaedon cochleariae]|uniref:Beta-sarcoglycan n=1 Tax=Phaedon cochleariae TaxID=80249 RepID=A0A9P0DW75_PHACE|nr:unnamed protein product [Phaedon cochleariae]
MDGSSPSPITSEGFPEETDPIVMKEKAFIAEIASGKYNNNNNNFKNGYMPMEDIKPGMRGRKTIAFWTLLILLFILVIGNLILTVTIIGVLRLGKGMQSMELVPEEETIKFFGDANLDHIYKRDGKVEGFKDQPLEITADDSPLYLSIVRDSRAVRKVKIDPSEIVFRGLNTFEVLNEQKESVFTITDPVYHSLKNAHNLKTNNIETTGIRSPLDHDLQIEGDTVSLKGAEGTEINAKDLLWNVDQDIFLKSINGSIVLISQDGVFIDIARIPIAKLNHNYVTSQFKVCVCMPEGKLFRIPVANTRERVYCDHVDLSPQYNPCI